MGEEREAVIYSSGNSCGCFEQTLNGRLIKFVRCAEHYRPGDDIQAMAASAYKRECDKTGALENQWFQGSWTIDVPTKG